MSKIYLPNSTQLDTLNEKLGDIGETLAGQQLVTKDSVVSALGYEPAERDLVYINSATITADGTKMVNFTTDSAGNNLRLKRILMQVTFPDVVGDNSLYCGLGNYRWVAYCYIKTCTRVLFDIQPAGGDAWYALMYRSTTTGSTITYNATTSTGGFVVQDGTAGVASGVSCYSNSSIPTGSKIDVYGIRA